MNKLHITLKISLLLTVASLAPLATLAANIGASPTFASTTGSLSQGLVGYWPLDGKTTNWTNGTTLDMSGNGNTGSLTNMSTTTSPGAGKIGQALSFNGSVSSAVSSAHSSSLDSAGTSFTLSTWMYLPSDPPPSTNIYVLNYAFGQYSSYQMGIQYYSGTYRAILRNNNGGMDGSAGYGIPFTAGKWHLVTGTYDGTTLTYYVDGISQKTTTISPYLSLAFSLSIGGNTFTSKLDDIRIYNRALSPTEVQHLYAMGGGTTLAKSSAPTSVTSSLASGLMGYWTMDGKDTNWATGRIIDRSGNGNSAILIRASTSTTPQQGKIGQAIRTNNPTNMVVNAGTGIINASQAISISVWVKLYGYSNYAGLVAKWSSCSEGEPYVLEVTGSTPKYWQSASNVLVGDALSIGKWYHIVVTNDANGSKLYYNGKVNKNGSAAPAPTTSSAPWYFGSCAGSVGDYAYSLNGVIDDVRIYNRALSATEVQHLYAMGGNGLTTGASLTSTAPASVGLNSGLVAYWTFDGKDTNWNTLKVTDRSGQGNTGQMMNMSTTTSPVLGKIGQALFFPDAYVVSTGSYISVGAANISPPCTMSVWVKQRPYTSQGLPIVGGTGGYASLRSVQVTSNKVGLTTSTPTDYTFSSPGYTVVNGVWTHLTTVVDSSSSARLYVNGQFNGSITGATALECYRSIIGRNTSGTLNYFSGTLDDLRIYNRALSPTEVQQLYASGK